MSNIEFKEFPKLARLIRGCLITEKIDGTNAQVFITMIPKAVPGLPDPVGEDPNLLAYWYGIDGSSWGMYAGSRNRWINPAADNFGFAAWVKANTDELKKLGPGRHFGEWWGHGIQRGYGLPTGQRRFSLFNVPRWEKAETPPPACVSLVPVLYRGDFSMDAIDDAMGTLRTYGSKAVPGFLNPEGIVIFHGAANIGFKRTLENDSAPKSLIAAAA